MSLTNTSVRRYTDKKGVRRVERGLIKRGHVEDLDEQKRLSTLNRWMADQPNAAASDASPESDMLTIPHPGSGDGTMVWGFREVQIEVGAPYGDQPAYWAGLTGTVRLAVCVSLTWGESTREAFWDDGAEEDADNRTGSDAAQRLRSYLTFGDPDLLSREEFPAAEAMLAEAARRFGAIPVPVRAILPSDTPRVTIPRDTA